MAVFCSCFTSCFPGKLFGYFLNDFEMVLGAHIITVSLLFYIPYEPYFYCEVFTLYYNNLIIRKYFFVIFMNIYRVSGHKMGSFLKINI
jgi:hypothetical protein